METLADGLTRIQLCGRLVAEIDGRRVEDALPGRQGRLLFGFLVASRRSAVSRSQLHEVLWPAGPPASPEGGLRPVLSKLRQVLGEERIEGRSELRLVLPSEAQVDVELAAERLHDAESAAAQERWAHAWLPGRIALTIAERPFMAGHEGEWIEDRRRELDELRLRALECIARTGLGLGGAEIDGAERAARSLVRLSPFRESGHALLMRALAERANVAEALRVYDDLRRLLNDELGVAPSAEAQALHERLLARA